MCVKRTGVTFVHARTANTSGAQVIVVHGPAGGVGKTLIALYLAYLYADKGLSTILVDLAQYGAIAPLLRIPRGASSGVTGLVAALGQGGPTDLRIQGALVQAPGANANLHLVLSSGPAKMDQLRASEIETLIKHLGATSQVIIVDTGSELSDRTLGALLSATTVLLTVTPQVTVGWQALEFLEIARSAYIPKERISAVFNRVQTGGKFGLAEYEQVIGLPVAGVIPETPELRASTEKGGPPDLRRKHPGVRALRQLAHQLNPVFTPKELKRAWL